MASAFITKDDSYEFLDNVQLPALSIHHVTMSITHTGSIWLLSSCTTRHSQWPWNQASLEINLTFFYLAAPTEVFKGRLCTIPGYV